MLSVPLKMLQERHLVASAAAPMPNVHVDRVAEKSLGRIVFVTPVTKRRFRENGVRDTGGVHVCP